MATVCAVVYARFLVISSNYKSVLIKRELYSSIIAASHLHVWNEATPTNCGNHAHQVKVQTLVATPEHQLYIETSQF